MRASNPPRVMIALAAFASQAAADVLPRNALCTQNQVQAFTLENTQAFPDGSPDFCHLSVTEVPAEVTQALSQIGDLNRRAAQYFRLSPERLLGTGVQIALIGSDYGVMASYASEDKIRIGVWAEWPRTLDPAINPAVYLHELGHVISLADRNALPKVIHELSHTVLFQETFSDLLAWGITGRVISPSADLPGCLTDSRTIHADSTYRAPMGTFDNYASARQVRQCCHSLQMGQMGQINQMHPMAQTELVKQAVATAMHPSSPAQRFCAHLDDIYPDTDAIPFDGSDFNPLSSNLDPHQVGIPLNSFLIDLSRSLGKPLNEFYFPMLSDFSLRETELKFKCVLPRFSKTQDPFQTSSYSFRQVFDHLRKSLTPEEQIEFDRLWKRHAMARAMTLADKDAIETSKGRAQDEWLQRMLHHHSSFYSPENICIETLRDPYPKDTSCRAQCVAD